MTKPLLFVLLLGSLVWSGVAHANYRHCLKKYRTKQYTEAAQCLQQLAKQLDQIAKPSKAQKLTKGSALRSAAIALRKAANRTPDIEISGYLRIKAIRLLLRYERERLFPNALLQKSAHRLRLQLQEALQLTPLSVIGPANTTLQIKGYQFQANAVGKWLQSVRPGRYIITSLFANGRQRRRQIVVKPGKSAFVTFKPPPIHNRQPPPRAKSPSQRSTIGWIILGLGGAGMAVGVVSFALLQGANATVVERGQSYVTNCTNQPGLSTTCADQGRAIREAHSSGRMLQLTGIISLIAGAALAATGGILVGLAPKANQTDALSPSNQGKTLLSTNTSF